MLSMTGYGRGEAKEDGRKITVELKAVNNRFLDINYRFTSRSLGYCEDTISKIIKANIARGTIDVILTIEDSSQSSKSLAYDENLAREYVSICKKLRVDYMLEDDFGVTALLRSPEVIKIESTPVDIDKIISLVGEATKIATSELNAMRAKEGQSIEKDLNSLISTIVSALQNIILRAPSAVAEYREKLIERIKDFLKDITLDEARIINEVAFYSDKVDINEELSRLASHIDQFLACIAKGDNVGRKLDFIAQEMNREVNTIASKAKDMLIINDVVLIKNELEKIKEQIRNIE